MTTPLKQMTPKQLQQRSLGPLQQLADRWRVVGDDLGDPLIQLKLSRGFVYEIDIHTLGLWLNGKPGWWIRELRKRFVATDVRQRGDTETVIAWLVADSRTNDLLKMLGAYRNLRRRSSAQQAAIKHLEPCPPWTSQTAPLGVRAGQEKGLLTGRLATQAEKTGSDTGQGETEPQKAL